MHKIQRKPNERTLKELARELEMPEITLYRWLLGSKVSKHLIWSYILDYENSKNPFQERQEQIAK